MSDGPRDLETVLADARQRAQLLRAEGHPVQAASIDRVCEDVSTTMKPYLTWQSETEAQLRSGWSVARLRGKFPEWEAVGFARLSDRGKREYREAIVPVRADRSTDKLAGMRGQSLKKASGS
jgi:hypothetical protein